ncbi:MAG TPA: hypothetical protein VHV77_06585 [Pirellulales bacterium]|nr:hypothetical protein [Pirellulales bacterium]
MGDTPTEASRQLGVSLGRISQMRAALKKHWGQFYGETPRREKCYQACDLATP